MQRWQYKTLTYGWDEERQDLTWADTRDLVVNAEMVDKRLNELGSEGWELISIEKSAIFHILLLAFILNVHWKITTGPLTDAFLRKLRPANTSYQKAFHEDVDRRSFVAIPRSWKRKARSYKKWN